MTKRERRAERAKTHPPELKGITWGKGVTWGKGITSQYHLKQRAKKEKLVAEKEAKQMEIVDAIKIYPNTVLPYTKLVGFVRQYRLPKDFPIVSNSWRQVNDNGDHNELLVFTKKIPNIRKMIGHSRSFDVVLDNTGVRVFYDITHTRVGE